MAHGYTFWGAMKIGSAARVNVAEYYAAQGHKVADVEADKFFGALGVDLVISDVGLVEVKGDTWAQITGNVYIETVANTRKGTAGGTVSTQADILVYYVLAEGWALVIPVPALHEWASRRLAAFPEKGATTVMPDRGGATYSNKGRVVPWRVVLAEVAGTTRIDGLPAVEVARRGTKKKEAVST